MQQKHESSRYDTPIIFLNPKPPYSSEDFDPRRRELYGENVNWISPGPECRRSSLAHPIRRFDFKSTEHSVSVAQKKCPNAVLVTGHHGIAVSLSKRNIRFAFDPIDSIALYFDRRARATAMSAPLIALNSIRMKLAYRHAESRIARSASALITTGPADEAYLKKLVPEANILRIGNGTKLVNETPVVPVDNGATIGFHGNMTWAPNVTTADYLSGRISHDLAASQRMRIRVRIAGRPVPTYLQKRDGKNGVEICGFVRDIRSWMSTLSLYVMPMYQGAGVKNKLIEAMAMGLPVLTNERGAEMLDDEGRECVEIVQNDHEIPRMICTLLADSERRDALRQRSRKYAETHFRWELHRSRLHRELARLKADGQL